MCGRYALTTPADVLAQVFRLAQAYALRPRYNIAPTQRAPIVLGSEDGDDAGLRVLREMRWGLIPFWSKDASIGARLINARSETAADKPAFRDAFRKRCCVVPATGFFEWKKIESDGKKQKQPWFIHRADDAPMALAGLWERWADKETGEEIQSYTILTTEPNDAMAALHNRMPVILDPDAVDAWLDPAMRDPAELADLFKPIASDAVAYYPVSRRVNSPKNDDASILDRVDDSPQNLFEQ